MGTPLLANPQLGVFYPLNWITAPFRAPDAIKLSILLHSVIAGAGMAFLYAVVFGARRLPMVTAAIVYAFSATLGGHVEQINQFQGLAWLPVLFALCHRFMHGDAAWRDGIAVFAGYGIADLLRAYADGVHQRRRLWRICHWTGHRCGGKGESGGAELAAAGAVCRYRAALDAAAIAAQRRIDGHVESGRRLQRAGSDGLSPCRQHCWDERCCQVTTRSSSANTWRALA